MPSEISQSLIFLSLPSIKHVCKNLMNHVSQCFPLREMCKINTAFYIAHPRG